MTSDDASATVDPAGEDPGRGARDAPADEPAEDAAGRRRRGQDFPQAGLWQRGYDVAQVETFLHDAERALRADPPTMAPYDIQDARFRGVRWRRGYDMRAVDERMGELLVALRRRHGDDSVGDVQGHERERHHRTAFWIYVTAGVLVLAIVAFAAAQMI